MRKGKEVFLQGSRPYKGGWAFPLAAWQGFDCGKASGHILNNIFFY